jgi:hypothetical protein
MIHIARKLLLGVALAMVGLQAQAIPIMITPTDCGTTYICWTGPSGPPAKNPTVADIEAVTGSTNLMELYKSDVSGSTGSGLDSFAFASSYDTVFSNSATDPQDALISYISGATINCPECFLLVKDGASDPNWYLFDISFWNGTDTLDLQEFWPNQGAISHVSIYGDASNVPEPSTLTLLGLGLLAMSLRRHLIKSS